MVNRNNGQYNQPEQHVIENHYVDNVTFCNNTPPFWQTVVTDNITTMKNTKHVSGKTFCSLFNIPQQHEP